MKCLLMLAGLICLPMTALGQSYLSNEIIAVDAAQQKHQAYWETVEAAKQQQELAKQRAEEKSAERDQKYDDQLRRLNLRRQEMDLQFGRAVIHRIERETPEE